MTPRARLWLPLLLCAVACSSGPPRRIYLLTPPINPAAPTTPSPAGGPAAPKQLLEVRRVLVPDYLDNADILMRLGSDEVKASSSGRWGERLSLALTHAMGADLAARLPQYSIVQDGSSNPQRQLRITITALDLWQNGRCVLSANWSIVDQDSRVPVTSGSGTFDGPSAGGATNATVASLVEAVARALGKLADGIVLDAQASPGRARFAPGIEAPSTPSARRCAGSFPCRSELAPYPTVQTVDGGFSILTSLESRSPDSNPRRDPGCSPSDALVHPFAQGNTL
jgi:uncharacterized lipoprotein YmbA